MEKEKTAANNGHDHHHPEILEEMTINDPDLVLVLLHEKKRQLLNCLVKERMTIQELSTRTRMNPGTIKRHLDDLIKNNLIFVQKKERNSYNVLMKYYRAVANEFHIYFRLPE